MEAANNSIRSLTDAAMAIDDSRSWQFLAGSREADLFDLSVVSRGPMGLLTEVDFEMVRDCVVIDAEPGDSYSKIQVVKYVGDIAGLAIFTDYLTGELDGRTEGDANPIKRFVSRNPWWALRAFGHDCI